MAERSVVVWLESRNQLSAFRELSKSLFFVSSQLYRPFSTFLYECQSCIHLGVIQWNFANIGLIPRDQYIRLVSTEKHKFNLMGMTTRSTRFNILLLSEVWGVHRCGEFWPALCSHPLALAQSSSSLSPVPDHQHLLVLYIHLCLYWFTLIREGEVWRTLS